jgi:hypothetical protein
MKIFLFLKKKKCLNFIKKKKKRFCITRNKVASNLRYLDSG